MTIYLFLMATDIGKNKGRRKSLQVGIRLLTAHVRPLVDNGT